MKYITCQAAPTLAEIELLERAPPMHLVVDVVQRVNGLVDAVDFGSGLRRTGRAAIALEGILAEKLPVQLGRQNCDTTR